ncbi:TPA: restriction endonuclease subunit S [Vibrio cholerae]
MSWSLVNLSTVCQIDMGSAPKGSTYVELDSGVPLIAGAADYGDVFPQPKKATLEPTKLCKKGDIIICVRATIGDLNWADKEYCLGRGVAGLRAHDEKLDSKYLWYFIASIEDELYRNSTGSTFPQINKKVIESLKIPLPPLETQKQIAAVLEKADQLRQDCKLLEQELNSLAQSVFIDMFGDPVTNPKGWDKVSLSKIADDFLGGKSLVAAEDQSTFYKNRVLKISAVTSGEFKPQESKPLPNDYEPQDEHFVKAGDLLFSRANTTELVGATAMVFDEHTGLVLPDKLWRFVWKDEKSLSPVFIWQQLCEAGVRKEISKLSSGSGGSMKNISKGKLNTLQIVFPPLALQQKFERIYLKLRVELSNNQQQIKFADQAFNALMQKAFKGELTL